MKLILTIFLSAAIFTSLAVYKRWQNGMSTIIPWPYKVEINQAELPEKVGPVAIIGDRLGARLSAFSSQLQAQISKGLSKPVEVTNLASKDEGLHRTLAKLKALKRPPLIIIYLGGSQEFLEERFDLAKLKTITTNFERYENPKYQTLAMIYPDLSRLIYKPMPLFLFNDKNRSPSKPKSDLQIMQNNQLLFKIFEYEANELMNYAKDANSYIITLSSPLNLDIPPRKNCDGTLDESGQMDIAKITKYIKNKEYKNAQNLSAKLLEKYSSSAQAYYTQGQLEKALGQYSKAKKNLELAMAFDCGQWRASPIFNQILKNSAYKTQTVFFDFDAMMKKMWPENELFLDENYPQNIYYEKLVSALATRIKTVLRL